MVAPGGARGCFGGEHTWLLPAGACMPEGDVHGEGGHVWRRGACMAKGGMCGKGGACVAKGGHAWQRGACVAKGGMCGMHPPPMRYSQSLRRQYASHWNAFLYRIVWFILHRQTSTQIPVGFCASLLVSVSVLFLSLYRAV